METADIPRAAEIHVFGWRCAYRGIIMDEVLFKDRTVAKSMERFAEYINNPASEDYVYDDGLIKAFMTIGACRDEDKPNSFELWGIYVEPLMKGLGIGSKMVAFCEKRARERGYNEITLWVLEKNEESRKFYEKMGFAPDGKKNPKDPWEIRYVKKLCKQKP